MPGARRAADPCAGEKKAALRRPRASARGPATGVRAKGRNEERRQGLCQELIQEKMKLQVPRLSGPVTSGLPPQHILSGARDLVS